MEILEENYYEVSPHVSSLHECNFCIFLREIQMELSIFL
jgi:hypothetical protein